MLTYLNGIWKCRHFWMSLVRHDLRTRYRRSFLGIAWSLLHPLCMTAILCLVFHKLFHQSVTEYAPQVLAGLAGTGNWSASGMRRCAPFGVGYCAGLWKPAE